METQTQKTLRVITNITWFFFGALFLSVGLFVIYGSAGWAWVGFIAAFLMGFGVAAVCGGKLMVRDETKGKVEHDI